MVFLGEKKIHYIPFLLQDRLSSHVPANIETFFKKLDGFDISPGQSRFLKRRLPVELLGHVAPELLWLLNAGLPHGFIFTLGFLPENGEIVDLHGKKW